jgi:hypothetical protein
MGKHFVGIKGQQLLSHRDRFVEAPLILKSPDEPMHGVEHTGIRFQATAKRGCCSRGIALRQLVEAPVVEFFGYPHALLMIAVTMNETKT